MEDVVFDGVIKEMCLAAGFADWRQVAGSGHLQVNNRVVGLLHRAGDIHDDGLSILVELDVIDAGNAEMATRLLRENVQPAEPLQGFFGLHPETGKVVYSARLEGAPAVSGADLAAFVELQVHDAERVLAHLAA